jgi:hypothetical protein
MIDMKRENNHWKKDLFFFRSFYQFEFIRLIEDQLFMLIKKVQSFLSWLWVIYCIGFFFSMSIVH